MLVYLGAWLAEYVSAFNVFRYLTFRAGGALFTAFLLAVLSGPWVIAFMRRVQKDGQPVREDGPASHLERKQGIPTMGGVWMVGSMVVATLLWADVANGYVWLILAVVSVFLLVGLADDIRKLRSRSSKGLAGKVRLGIEGLAAVAMGVGILALAPEGLEGVLVVPLFKDVVLALGAVGFLLFTALVVVGSANAVNLTDGLDGLAVAPAMIAAGALGLIAWVAGNALLADYLQLPFVQGVGELSVLCAALIGAGIGFLWFNAPPAKVFMGDTGSLALGAALGGVAVATRHELVFAVIGGLFVLEAVSVMVQVASFRLTGKRVFRMAPFHHHLEQKGWEESTIVIRLWIVAFLLAMVGLAMLKVR